MTVVPQPGVALAGRYEIERELGQGGMATVYLARDTRHDAPVAVKVLHPELAAAFGGGRFVREIQITARLQHPNILPVLDSGEADGLPYYTMPFVEGETLAARLDRERQIPIADAIRIAREVAEALAYAHERGIVHRDIKPSNVLLAGYPPHPGATAAWHALLADFGIARAMDTTAGERITDTGIALGTAHYMSPEQAAGERTIDGRSDIYALGCVLYEMLAGTPPFHGPSAQAILARHALDTVPNLQVVRQTVGPALARVVNTALAKVPADRYQDAASFRDALDAAEAEQRAGVTGQTAPAATRPAAAARSRRRLLVAGGALGAVLVAAGAATLVWRVTRARSLDENRVVVFPFAVSGSAPALASAGENVATLVEGALDGARPLRAVDGWRLLGAAERAAVHDVSFERLGAIARGQRARWFVTGTVTPTTGDSAVVSLSLVDVADDSTRATRSVRGLAREAHVLGPRALNGVLGALIGGAPRDVAAEWSDRPTAAVAHYLLGEAAFRRARAEEALAHYREAVGADSTFGLAAVRGAQAAAWTHRDAEAEALVRVALAHGLAPRYEAFARGYAAYLAGRADSAEAAFRRATELDPDMAVAWVALGEVHTHLLPASGSPDSLAEQAFDRARRLDPSAANLLHPIQIGLRRGDTARATPLVERFLAAGPDSVLGTEVRVMDACVRRGPAAVAWDAEVARSPLGVLNAGHALAGGGGQLPCAEAAFAAVQRADTASGRESSGRRWAAVVGRQSILVARGRPADAARVIDSAIAAGLGGSTLFLLDATVAPELAGRADSVAAEDARLFGPSYERSPYPIRLWHLGLWAGHRGRAELASAIATNLAATAGRTGRARDSLFARGVAAHAALARRDTADALRRLAALVSEPTRETEFAWDLVSPHAAERLLLARVLLARGDARAALGVASVFDAPSSIVHVLYLPESLRLRAAAAERVGNPQLAATFRARLAALGGGPAVAAR